MPEVKGMEEPIKSGTAGEQMDKCLKLLGSIGRTAKSARMPIAVRMTMRILKNRGTTIQRRIAIMASRRRLWLIRLSQITGVASGLPMLKCERMRYRGITK